MSEEEYWAQFPDTLSPAMLGDILRLSAPVIRIRLREGVIPGHSIGGQWIVFKAELREWLNSRSNRPRAIEGSVDLLASYPDALTVKDLTILFGRSRETLYIWLDKGHIPGTRVGEQWIIHKWDLAKALAATSNQPTP